MSQRITQLEQTFLDLVAIDEVHPHEKKVLEYITGRLEKGNVPYKKDPMGNIVARIPGSEAAGEALALVAHTDIAAPLAGRQVVVDPDVIKTDGTGLLGGDDKAAVAALLELVSAIAAGRVRPASPLELLFTVGEESGCLGAKDLDMKLLSAKRAIVLDWTGRVNNVVTQSPAYIKIDVEYVGRTAHPAEWQAGRNAGAALIDAANQIKVGEYEPGVTCNIGIFGFGKARNQVPGVASLQAELRSFDTAKADAAAAQVEQTFRDTAKKHGVEPKITIAKDSPAYRLDQSGALFRHVAGALGAVNLTPNLQPTYGCFDGGILAGRGLDVVMMGAGYHNPHSPGEYVNRAELAEIFEFLGKLCDDTDNKRNS